MPLERPEFFRELIVRELDIARQALADTEGGNATVELDQARVGRLSRMDALQQQAMSAGLRERLRVRIRRLQAAERDDSSLQAWRIEEVADRIRELGARSVLDLGCGEGELLARLAALPDIERIIGVDRDPEATEAARAALSALAAPERDRVEVLTASFLDDRLGVGAGVDAVTLVEVIEHIDPRWLSAFESRVFGGAGGFDARFVLVSTPNADYNPIYGLAPGEFRHLDHRFEWGRRRFRAWAQRIGGDYGYRWAISGIGSDDPVLGQPTQLAVFEKPVVRRARA